MRDFLRQVLPSPAYDRAPYDYDYGYGYFSSSYATRSHDFSPNVVPICFNNNELLQQYYTIV